MLRHGAKEFTRPLASKVTTHIYIYLLYLVTLFPQILTTHVIAGSGNVHSISGFFHDSVPDHLLPDFTLVKVKGKCIVNTVYQRVCSIYR